MDVRNTTKIVTSDKADGWNLQVLFSLRQNIKNSEQYLFFETIVSRNPKADGTYTRLPDGTMLQSVVSLSPPNDKVKFSKANSEIKNLYTTTIKVDTSKEQYKNIDEIDLYSNASCGKITDISQLDGYTF